jgi:hypothetical protein
MKSAKIQWNHQHVDGHTDDVSDHVLSPLEWLNTEMDAKAKAFWLTTHTSSGPCIQYINDEPWSLTVGNKKIFTDLANNFHDWCQRPRIQAFWVEKARIPVSKLVHVNYSAAGSTLKSNSVHG